MAIKNEFNNWDLSLAEMEAGGFGSSTRTFRVPAQYKKYYTTTDAQGNEVYNKELAFKEAALLFVNAIIHRYQDKLLTAGLYETALLIGKTTQKTSINDTTTQIKLIENLYVEPQFGANIYFGNLAQDTVINVFKDSTDQSGLTYNLQLISGLQVNIDEDTEVLLTSEDAYIYMEHTRNNVKASIYKGIQFASQNREFWQIVKDSSFSGPNWSFNSQTSNRILSNDIFGIEANTLLENAELDEYKIIEHEDGYKEIYYKGQKLYTSNKFDISIDVLFADQIDDDKIADAESAYA